jgi:Bacterial capsule synthesis protein PGA_cap
VLNKALAQGWFALFFIMIYSYSSSLLATDFVIYAGGDTFPSNVLSPNKHKSNVDFKELTKDKTLFSANLEGSFCADDIDKKVCSPEFCDSYTLVLDQNQTISTLKSIGIDHAGLANNHSYDCGRNGSIYTQRLLKRKNIAFSGSKNAPFTIINKNGKNIAILSLGSNTFTPNFNNLASIEREIYELALKRAKGEISLWIINMHIGTEKYPDALRITKNEEIYLDEKRGNPYALARFFIDIGADMIIGHGPHVPRGLDIYKNRLIAYSLGNFYTDYGIGTKGDRGVSPLLKAVMNDNGEFIRGEIISLEQQSHHYPILDVKKQACSLMSKLTSELTNLIEFEECDIVKISR